MILLAVVSSSEADELARALAQPPFVLEVSPCCVAWRSDASWKEPPRGGAQVHSLDRFLLDADRSRQQIEDRLEYVVHCLFPKNTDVNLKPGNNRFLVEIVFRY